MPRISLWYPDRFCGGERVVLLVQQIVKKDDFYYSITLYVIRQIYYSLWLSLPGLGLSHALPSFALYVIG